jgi:hypothetical protein
MGYPQPSPKALSCVLSDAVHRLNGDGALYIYIALRYSRPLRETSAPKKRASQKLRALEEEYIYIYISLDQAGACGLI